MDKGNRKEKSGIFVSDRENLVEEIFTKYFWDEEKILFYSHFQNNYAVRQIEVYTDKVVFLSEENPFQGESMLYDGKYEDLEISENQFITREEFEDIWRKKNK